ncbi:hypothetical protein J7T55_002193 [Diaporthe amygdali]|uniref:uncharacterized protein n=1 Tax=Phomopsis amygdali TaxID=1214568 RepID=UPI0022FE040E|nr:uncharacterized protein J7T55_002193 [Diaporthe amygdali]KAJ0103774.1 hypothetical protein J7T55_002193 [Diaporthe amygdali]
MVFQRLERVTCTHASHISRRRSKDTVYSKRNVLQQLDIKLPQTPKQPTPPPPFRGANFPGPMAPCDEEQPGMTGSRPPRIPYNHTASTAHLIKWPAISGRLRTLLQGEKIGLLTDPRQSAKQCHLFQLPGEDSTATPMPVDLDPAKVQSYVEFYKNYIQIVHPLIPPQKLDQMVGRYPQSKDFESTLVLLVLALGNLCQWRSIRDLHDSQSETIPGKQYFDHVTGNLVLGFGTPCLNLIRAHVLASLYCDQLGWVADSFRYIRFAGSAILDRLHVDMLESETIEVELRVIFCDLLSHHHLSPSHVLDYDHILTEPAPFELKDLGFSNPIAVSYAAHIDLRKVVNKIFQLLYDKTQNLGDREEDKIMTEIEGELMRKSWQASDPSSSGDQWTVILSARARYKLLEAEALAYRPWLKRALNLSVDECLCVPDSKNAEKCIDAILKSLTAFHALEKRRIIITSVVGTVYFQIGNLIALSTVFHNERLRRFVDGAVLRRLLRKTIEFLETVAQCSRGLAVGLKILKREEELLRRGHVAISPALGRWPKNDGEVRIIEV